MFAPLAIAEPHDRLRMPLAFVALLTRASSVCTISTSWPITIVESVFEDCVVGQGNGTALSISN
jgi:hypothetical protein